MTPEQLEAIEGIGPKTVEKISIAVNNYFASLDGGEAVAAAEPENTGEAVTEAAVEAPEGSTEEGSVEADALAAELESTGVGPNRHRRRAGRKRGLSVEAEPGELRRQNPTEEAATEEAATEQPRPKKPRKKSRAETGTWRVRSCIRTESAGLVKRKCEANCTGIP